MIMPDRIKNVLVVQGIKIDTAKDYSLEELNVLYEKIIYFLDRKILKISVQETTEVSCTTNLEKLSALIPREFEVLGFEGLTAKYDKEYLLSLHCDERYTIAEAVSLICKENGIALPHMWANLVANYGVLNSGA